MPVFSSSCMCPPYKIYALIISLLSCHCPYFFTFSSHFFVHVVTVCITLLHNFFHKYWSWLFQHRKRSCTPLSVAFSIWFQNISDYNAKSSTRWYSEFPDTIHGWSLMILYKILFIGFFCCFFSFFFCPEFLSYRSPFFCIM